MKKIRVKQIKNAVILFCFLTVLCIAANICSVQNTENSSGREELLLWSYYETSEQRKALDDVVEEFNQQQENYHLSWEYVPMTEFIRKLSIGVLGEETPDIVLMDNPDMKSCIQQGILEDMTEELKDIDESLYFPQVWESVTYDGKLYGVPFCCNSLLLIYNKDLFEEYGIDPPDTPQQLYETAKMLTSGSRKGFIMSAVSGEQGAFQIFTWILNEGETVETLGGEATQSAFSFVKKMIDEEIMDIQCINWTQVDICRKFIEGEAAMMMNGPWIFDMLDESGVSYDMVLIPSEGTSSSIIGGENLGVIAGKNKEGAAEFLRFYLQDDVMYRVCEEQGALPPKIQLAEIKAQEDPRYEQIKNMVEQGISRTSIPNWETLSEKLTINLRDVILGEISPEEAALAISN